MPRIYCSVCADTSSLPGSTCLHCGAVSREARYELSSYTLLALAVIVVLAIATVWGFAKGGPRASLGVNVQQDAYQLEEAAPATSDAFGKRESAPMRAANHRDA